MTLALALASLFVPLASADVITNQCASITTFTELPDGSVLLRWEPIGDALVYAVHRSTSGPDGPFDSVDVDPATTEYIDNTVGASVENFYFVIANPYFGTCPAISLNESVPFFPSLLAGALAMVGAAAVAIVVRRR